ncbi:MAG: putative aminohydrolase SsnA [Chloroflexota bacterium]|nr:putative aminohydrolase SsnA [Chloroflexota bacterium]
MSQSILIHNATVCTFGDDNRVIEDGAVLVQDGEIAAVASSQDLLAAYPDAAREDAGGKLLMPGNICTHTHYYGAFARGMYIPGPAPRDFPEILRRLWWTLDRALDDDGVLFSALVCLVDAIRNGTTTLIDHHASPAHVDGSLSIIAGAVETAGLRSCLCYEVTDRNGPEEATAGIAENVRFIKETRRPGSSPLVAGTFGLHASLSLSDETLAQCVAEAESLGNVGFHIHAAEGPADQEDSQANYGLRTIDRLKSRGILGPHTIVAHVTAIDPWEMETLRESNTWITHQPRSNMNNAVGVADVPAMMRGGMPICLGNDGFSNDMFSEMKQAYLLHKVWQNDPRVASGDQIVQMAYGNNAALARLFFQPGLGQISPGAAADLILLDYYPPTPLSNENLPWHILFGVSGSHVTHTMVAGRWLMKDRQLLTLDEAAITARSREVARETWQRYWE